jgi:hypothetical protein
VAPSLLPATQQAHSSRAQGAFCGPSAKGQAQAAVGAEASGEGVAHGLHPCQPKGEALITSPRRSKAH